MEKKHILLIDLYGVIIKESKGFFIPYTYAHFEPKEHDRLTKAFREDQLFTKAGNGDLSSDEFLTLLGYPDPQETMRDYLDHFLTLDPDFVWFAERYHAQYDFVLLSNDVKEWNHYLFDRYGLHKYFRDRFVSGELHMRKPERRIFTYALSRLQCRPQECLFIDNSVTNLEAAQTVGMHTVLFNRDHEAYTGDMVNNFEELAHYLKKFQWHTSHK